MKTSALPISMDAIIGLYQPGEGRHFFDKDTRRFFNSRLPQYGWRGAGGTFFATSEKPPLGIRRYSVRQLVGEGKIETIGEFCSLDRDKAHSLAKRYADKGIDQQTK